MQRILSESRVIARFMAPLCNFCNQFQRKGFIIRKLDCSLACPVHGQTVSKMLYGFIAGIQAYMLFMCGKMYYIILSPVSRHSPGNTLFSIRKRLSEGIPDIIQNMSDFRRLFLNIRVNRFWRLTAIMALIFIFKLAIAFWTFPHSLSLDPFLTVSSGCFPVFCGYPYQDLKRNTKDHRSF